MTCHIDDTVPRNTSDVSDNQVHYVPWSQAIFNARLNRKKIDPPEPAPLNEKPKNIPSDSLSLREELNAHLKILENAPCTPDLRLKIELMKQAIQCLDTNDLIQIDKLLVAVSKLILPGEKLDETCTLVIKVITSSRNNLAEMDPESTFKFNR